MAGCDGEPDANATIVLDGAREHPTGNGVFYCVGVVGWGRSPPDSTAGTPTRTDPHRHAPNHTVPTDHTDRQATKLRFVVGGTNRGREV